MFNEICALDHVFTNYLFAQEKLFPQATPRGQGHQALRAARDDLYARERVRTSARRAGKTLPKAMAPIRCDDLYREIRYLTARLGNMALSKAFAAVKPRVNESFNNLARRRCLLRQLIQSWERS